MRKSAYEKRPRALNAREKELLRLAEACEPSALILEERVLGDLADALVDARFLGRVEVRGDQAYRLTEFGRVALSGSGSDRVAA
jgi:hypothetical protein